MLCFITQIFNSTDGKDICGTHSGSLTLGEYPQTSGHPTSPILSRSCRRLDRENRKRINITDFVLQTINCASVENMRLTSRWRRLVSVVGHHLSSHSNQIWIQHRVLCLSDLSNLSDLFPLTSNDCENCQIGTGFCSSLYRRVAICVRLHARICGSSDLGRVSGCWSGCVGVSSGSQGLNIWRPARALLQSS